MRNTDGTALALGTTVAIAAAVGLARRGKRGSWADLALSELQQALLKVKNTYQGDPEVVLRAQDVVISLLGRSGDAGLPGTALPATQMLADIKKLSRNPEATLADYMEVQVKQVRDNKHFSGQDLAGRTHYASMVPWIAREVSRIVKESRETAGAGARKSRRPDDLMLEKIRNLRTKVPRIADWRGGARPNLFDFDVDAAHAASDTWHEDMERKRKAEAGKLMKKAREDGGKVVYTFKDGWTIQDLYSWPHLQDESDRLHHCVGRTTTYWDGVQRGQWRIQSLRDKDGVAWDTLTVEPGGSILYCKGHFDRLPGQSPYSGTMAKGIPPEILLLECQHLQEYAKHLNPNASLSGDLAPCARLLQEEANRKAEQQKKARGQVSAQAQESPIRRTR